MSTGLLSFAQSLAFNSEGGVKWVSRNNRPCQARPTLANKNSNEPLYYPFTVNVNICGESYNTIDDLYALVCVPDKAGNINVKVYDLISRVNETSYLVKNAYLVY